MSGFDNLPEDTSKSNGLGKSFSFKLEKAELSNLINDMNEFNDFYNNCS